MEREQVEAEAWKGELGNMRHDGRTPQENLAESGLFIENSAHPGKRREGNGSARCQKTRGR
jgi:hypothetical protein